MLSYRVELGQSVLLVPRAYATLIASVPGKFKLPDLHGSKAIDTLTRLERVQRWFADAVDGGRGREVPTPWNVFNSVTELLRMARRYESTIWSVR